MTGPAIYDGKPVHIGTGMATGKIGPTVPARHMTPPVPRRGHGARRTSLALTEPMFEHAHLIPYREYWDRGDGRGPERLYGEIYTGERLNREYETITEGRGPELPEVALLSLIFASDATLLTNFGSASLWPIYM